MTTHRATEESASWPDSAIRWIETFFDDESYLPIGARGLGFGSGENPRVLAGVGTVDGRYVTLIAEPARPTGMGGPGDAAADNAIGHAMETGCPLLFLTVGGPSSDTSLIRAPRYRTKRLVHLSGVVPLINIEIGMIQPAGSFLDALSDFTVIVGTASERESAYAAPTLDDACTWVKDLLEYLPQNNCEFVAVHDLDEPGPAPALGTHVPDLCSEPYDLEPVLDALCEGAETVHIGRGRADALTTAFARIGGRSVGVLANQTAHAGGLVGPPEAKKAARFVQFCDAFNLPLLFLVDTAGPAADSSPADPSYAQLAYATAAATVPSITVILRRALGFAGEVFGSKHLGIDAVLAWPSASVAPAGFHREVEAEAGGVLTDSQRAEALQRRRSTAHDLNRAMDQGYIDQVVEPSETVQVIARWYAALDNKRRHTPAKKHGNPPL
ncbi:carboxyl transferase domain-containing protein [Arthrobacter sp. NPDC093128]|uniref:carboxyl transferase domain-containing protein n=1 Tax=Arthrobacter sp. NPDC093128 TaxID=3154979 RepID=UPI0034377E97